MIKKEIIKELIVSFQHKLDFHLHPRRIEIPASSGKIVVLKGVRRSGKSSVLYLTIAKAITNGLDSRMILFLNFDDERLDFQVHEFDLILQAYRELYPEIELQHVWFLFDEIQVSDGWEQFIRRIYDQESTNIFLTGSNSKLLSSEIATSLRGRTLQYEIFPLSFAEFCEFKNITGNKYNPKDKATFIKNFRDYLLGGGFPELIIRDFGFSDMILQEYFHVMLYRDLIERYAIKNLPALKYFIKRILANITKPTSINKIYNEVKSAGLSVSKNSLYEWADHLEAIYLLFPLPRFDFSLIKESQADKKYYCVDNGLLNALSTSVSQNYGALLENAVFLWIRRNIGMTSQVHYFKGNKACDFVVRESDKIKMLIQVCWDISDEATKTREINGLIEASNELNCDNLLLITSETEEEITFGGKFIRVLPAWWILQQPLAEITTDPVNPF